LTRGAICFYIGAFVTIANNAKVKTNIQEEERAIRELVKKKARKKNKRQQKKDDESTKQEIK